MSGGYYVETRNSTAPMEYNQKTQGQVQLMTSSAFSQCYGIRSGRISPLNKYVHNIIEGEKIQRERGDGKWEGGTEERERERASASG